MPCDSCGGTLDMVSQSGGTTEGWFQERYKCLNCGARGRISGDAGFPAESWDHTGKAFGGV